MHSKCEASLTTWVLLIWMCTSAMAGFAEIPANMTVELGTEAPPFRCRHMMSDAHISWSVNGSPSGRFPDIRSGSVNESGTIVDTLTVPAEPQYNGTVVECVAFFFDGSLPDVSPAATIFFTPTVLLPETTRFEMTPTNIPPGITETPTNTPPGITETPTNTPPGTTNFVITPSPLTVAVEQGTATFQCQHPQADVIGWRLNGTSLNMAALPNVSTTTAGTPNGVTTILSIGTLLVYNGTMVECLAFTDGSSPQITTPVALLIQGPLDPVSNVRLARSFSTLFWTPPFSLDLTSVDPDIAYCVDIYNVTCGRRDLIVSDCDVTKPSYTSNAPDGYIYEYIITPRSNVKRARNGTPSQPLRERFSRFSDSISERNSVSTKNVQLVFLNLEPNRPVPSSYTVILKSVDGLEDVVLKTTNITTEGNVIVVDVDHRLPLNRVWNCTLLAYGCRQNTILRDIELSTHDIQNVSVSSHIPGQVSVTGEFVQGSSATGVLVTVVNATDLEHHLISRDDSGNGIDGVISGLPGGQYTVSIFVVSKDGLPFRRTVTKPRRVSVKNAAGPVGDRPLPAIEYGLDQTSDGVDITCTFLDDFTTDCVAVVHQQISQLNSSGLTNIESSRKFMRSGDTADGSIEGVDMKHHQVKVIDGKMITVEPKSKNRESLAGAVVGILGGIAVAVIVTVSVIVAVVACTRLKRRRKTAAQPVYSQVTPRSGSQAHTIVNIESGSRAAVENHYESAGLSEKPAEEQPLLPPPPLPPIYRVEDDGGSSPGVSTPHASGSADRGTHTSPTADSGAADPIAEEDPPPLPPRLDDSAPLSESADQSASASPHQIISDNGAGDPTYASVLARTPNTVPGSADPHTHTSPTADGAGDPPGRPPEECPPPLPPKLMDDGRCTPHSAYQSTPHQVTSDNGAGDPTYAPVLITTPNAVSQPAATEKVSYEDIQKYQNEKGQHYALPQLKVTKKGPVDDLHQVVYTKVKPHSMTKTGEQNIDCTSDRAVTPPPVPSRETATVAVCEPVTTEQLFSFLLPHASKWQSLGVALSLDEDRLDEVYTNNERENDCLQEMLELYMLRSDLEHSWEEIQAALEKTESSNQQAAVDKELKERSDHKEEEGNSDSGYSGSQQSESESSDNSVVLEMEGDSTSLSQTSSEELPEASEKNRSTLNPLSENLKADKQEESSDSGCDYSQQSESESSDNSVPLEMEDDSTSLSQAALEERLEASEKSALSGDLEEYESRLDPSFGSQATLTDDGEFGRTINKKLPMPPTSTSINSRSRSPGLQLERFCEQPEDEENNDELCKIKPVHCQDSCIHNNYHEALIHQMGLLTDQKVQDKLEYNNAVEESSLVYIDSEQASKSLDVVFCTPKTFSALDITKVHELVPRRFSVSPKYSHPLMLTAVQLENDRLITLYFTCVILSVTYSSKLYAIINVCPVKVRVRCIMNID